MDGLQYWFRDLGTRMMFTDLHKIHLKHFVETQYSRKFILVLLRYKLRTVLRTSSGSACPIS